MRRVIERTLSEDGNADRIADTWQRVEVNRWNMQYGFVEGESDWIDPDDPDTWTPIFGENGEADAEIAMSEGPTGDSPAMADDGDGLTALQEYRGFFLDGGPGIDAPRHKHLSVARKELLVECSEMEHIASVLGVFHNDPLRPGLPTDPGNQANHTAQMYDLTNIMERVSRFYRNTARGGVLDLYWVRDPLNDRDHLVVCPSMFVRRAYQHIGTYSYIEAGATAYGHSWLTVYHDRKLWEDDRERWMELYRPENELGIGIASKNRNPRCEHFVKLVLAGRKGYVNNAGEFRMSDIPHSGGGTAIYADEKKTSVIAAQAAIVYVNSLSECRPFDSAEQFLDTLAYAFAHEIGHLIIKPGDGLSENEHRLGDPPSLMGSGSLLSALILHEDEIKNIDLRGRAGIFP